MSTSPASSASPHKGPDLHAGNISGRLNWLRAGVLGANDGIVSVAALVVGVAAATSDTAAILIAAVAAIIAGAVSMGLGEYVSVSSQRDTERALVRKERWELENQPEEELEELTQLYQAKGLTRETAEQVAVELTAHDALAAHLETELRLAEDDESNPWVAAGASAFAFTIGAALPLIAVLIAPAPWRIAAVVLAVLFALSITGYISAHLGGASKMKAIFRVVFGGGLGLLITYLVGAIVGAIVGTNIV